jgi:hypothetical protein
MIPATMQVQRPRLASLIAFVTPAVKKPITLWCMAQGQHGPIPTFTTAAALVGMDLLTRVRVISTAILAALPIKEMSREDRRFVGGIRNFCGAC